MVPTSSSLFEIIKTRQELSTTSCSSQSSKSRKTSAEYRAARVDARDTQLNVDNTLPSTVPGTRYSSPVSILYTNHISSAVCSKGHVKLDFLLALRLSLYSSMSTRCNDFCFGPACYSKKLALKIEVVGRELGFRMWMAAPNLMGQMIPWLICHVTGSCMPI